MEKEIDSIVEQFTELLTKITSENKEEQMEEFKQGLEVKIKIALRETISDTARQFVKEIFNDNEQLIHKIVSEEMASILPSAIYDTLSSNLLNNINYTANNLRQQTLCEMEDRVRARLQQINW